MRGRLEPSAATRHHVRVWRSATTLAVLMVCTLGLAGKGHAQDRDGDRGNGRDRRQQDRVDETTRREGAALVGLVDAAMSGHAASDFEIAWHNDFFKAQTGTFVPFTVTVDRARVSASRALMYVRATRRDEPPPARGQARYPFDLIFPVDLAALPGGPVRITRGFAVPPGEYDVYVALRERAPDPFVPEPRLKAAVLRQPLSVPDFWVGDLTTSSVMLVDRIDAIPAPLEPDDVLERPYVIGDNEIHPAADSSFRKDRELIVVFLIYNPTVSARKEFDIQVDYHLFRSVPQGAAPEVDAPASDHPAARPGERYVTHTDPQRFTPSLMRGRFDPEGGRPVMAGQGILLSSFQEGEYRLGITVTDMLSRRTLSRDVTFRVVGS